MFLHCCPILIFFFDIPRFLYSLFIILDPLFSQTSHVFLWYFFSFSRLLYLNVLIILPYCSIFSIFSEIFIYLVFNFYIIEFLLFGQFDRSGLLYFFFIILAVITYQNFICLPIVYFFHLRLLLVYCLSFITFPCLWYFSFSLPEYPGLPSLPIYSHFLLRIHFLHSFHLLQYLPFFVLLVPSIIQYL